MRKARTRARALAQHPDAPVLIIGERGSGRRMLARLIHEASTRRDAAVLTFDGCGLPAPLILSELFGHTRSGFDGAYREKKGLIWRVHGGSLIVTDVRRLPTDVQIALDDFVATRQVIPLGASRAIGTVDVRILATTDMRDDGDTGPGPFLRTLGERLRDRRVFVPALRERPDDIIELFEAFVEGTRADLPAPRLTRAAERLLVGYRWPGNVSELREIATRLIRRHDLGTTITAEQIARELASNQVRDWSEMPPV